MRGEKDPSEVGGRDLLAACFVYIDAICGGRGVVN